MTEPAAVPPLLLTVNVGGSAGGSAERAAAMTAWARDALVRQPLLVAAQEVPSDAWLSVWEQAGYRPWLGPDKGWRVRSALFTHSSLEVGELPDAVAAILDYHGSYVAGAHVNLAGQSLLVLSVHATPQKADPDKYEWRGDPSKPRHGGHDPRYTNERLWDSDLLLESLHRLSSLDLPVVAAGDYNEALAYDLDPVSGHRGTWAKEYFDRAREYGYTDVLSQRWGCEKPTRGGLQLDRVLVNQAALGLIPDGSPELDEAWEAEGHGLSDHRAVWLPGACP